MPIYEYQCSACGHRLEVIQKFSDAPLTDCPECGKSALQKMISAPSFQLKGGGWYQTDFKGMGRKKPDAGGETSKPASADKAGAAKPAGEAKAATAGAQTGNTAKPSSGAA
ncbi:MAG: zinc ribbon domain-containing protein [Gammaproteobacteria bacterium]|nr:MAG: zinc ribbon domain-containing protein [Gammaproteobacteria bacterium]